MVIGSEAVKPTGTSRRATRMAKASEQRVQYTDEERVRMARNLGLMFDLQRNVDCVFCVDTTGSMDPWI